MKKEQPGLDKDKTGKAAKEFSPVRRVGTAVAGAMARCKTVILGSKNPSVAAVLFY